MDWWLTTEDLPMPENRVTIDKDGNVHLAYTSTNDKEAEGLYEELKKILNHTGLAQHHVLDKNFYMAMNIPIAGVAHQAGTCRFGTDPATSVLDVNCKAHELDNLYVVDTSFFPSIGAVNPALTAIANAMRVGEHLRSRMALVLACRWLSIAEMPSRNVRNHGHVAAPALARRSRAGCPSPSAPWRLPGVGIRCCCRAARARGRAAFVW